MIAGEVAFLAKCCMQHICCITSLSHATFQQKKVAIYSSMINYVGDGFSRNQSPITYDWREKGC